MTKPSITVVLVCGGAARRFGADKLAADLAGTSVLDRTLAGLPDGWPVICVGPRRPTTVDVTWVREHPVGSGPAAAVAAGARFVTSPLVAVLAGDMPLAGPLLPALRTAMISDGCEPAAVLAESDGRANPLCAVGRTAALRIRLGRLGSAVVDAPARLLWPDDADRLRGLNTGAIQDVDTPEDLALVAATLQEQDSGAPS